MVKAGPWSLMSTSYAPGPGEPGASSPDSTVEGGHSSFKGGAIQHGILGVTNDMKHSYLSTCARNQEVSSHTPS